MIRVVVNNVVSTATNLEVLTAGMVKGRSVQFEFSSDWDLLNKTAVFTNGVDTRIVPEYKWSEGNVVDIPPEVLVEPHQFVRCGIYGIDEKGELIIPTLWADLGRVFPSASPDNYEESVPPTPNTWDDLQNQIGVLSKLDTEAKENLVKAINEVLSLALASDIEISQETGDSETAVMSQKITTEELNERITIIDTDELGDSAPTLRSLDNGLYLLSGAFKFNDIESERFHLLDKSFFIVRKTDKVTNVMCLNYDEMVYSSITDNSHSFNRFDHSTVDTRLTEISKNLATKNYVNGEFAKRDGIRDQIIKNIENTDGDDVYLTDFESGVYYLKGEFAFSPYAYSYSTVTLDNIAIVDHIDDDNSIVTVFGEKSYTRYSISSYTNEIDETYADVYGSTVDIFDLATKKSVEEAKAIAKGRSTGYVFASEADMNTWVGYKTRKVYKDTNEPVIGTQVSGRAVKVVELVLGDNLYIIDTKVPDYWWDGDEPQKLEAKFVDVDQYVKKTDHATTTEYGVVKIGGISRGIKDSDDGLVICNAAEVEIKAKTSHFKPIVPARLDYAVKMGLTDVKGTTWSDAEQKAAQNTLGITALVGDIETALDSIIAEQEAIIAIQNSLIGGDTE